MRKLAEVEDAKALMREAVDWSLFTWLWQKKRVRHSADMANDALDQLNKRIKKSWSEESRDVYRDLAEDSGSGGRKKKRNPQDSRPIDGQLKLLVKKAKDADEDARCARADAEATFDEADRLLSTSLAVEGCEKAIRSWELHEKAIRKAEAVLELERDQSPKS